MARATRRSRPSYRSKKPKHNWTNKLTRESKSRARFLDKGKENFFRYDLEDILEAAGVVRDHWGSFISSLFAKGSRQSIDDAKEFLKEKVAEGLFDDDTHKKIEKLIDRFSTWR